MLLTMLPLGPKRPTATVRLMGQAQAREPSYCMGGVLSGGLRNFVACSKL